MSYIFVQIYILLITEMDTKDTRKSLLSQIPREVLLYDILPALSHEQAEKYLEISPEIENKAEGYLKDPLYWKRRVEIKFNKGTPIGDYNVDWERIHNILDDGSKPVKKTIRSTNVHKATKWERLFDIKVWDSEEDIKHSNEDEILNHVANESELFEYIELAIDLGADPSKENNKAIIQASDFGYLNVVNRLLEDDRVDPSDLENEAIIQASAEGHLNIVDRLMQDDRVDPSDQYNMAIIHASRFGYLDIVNRLLMDPRVNPSTQENSAIIQASQKGHQNVVDRLMKDDRVNPSDRNNAAIIQASSEGFVDIVGRLLQDDRVDPSDQRNKSLIEAAKNKHENVIYRLLQDPRVNPSDRNNNALLGAMIYKYKTANIYIIDMLLQDPRISLSINTKKILDYAISTENLKIIFIFLDMDIFKEVLDDKLAHRIIKIALRYGDIKLATELLNKYDVSKYSESILEAAIESGLSEFVHLLMNRYVDNGNKFLIKAIEKGSLDVTNILLTEYQIDPSFESNKALNRAIEYKQSEITNILLNNLRVVDELNISGYYTLIEAIRSGDIQLVDKLIKDYHIDPSINGTKLLMIGIYNLDIFKLLLSDSRVDPSSNNNEVLEYAYNQKALNVIDILNKDNRIKAMLNNLTKENGATVMPEFARYVNNNIYSAIVSKDYAKLQLLLIDPDTSIFINARVIANTAYQHRDKEAMRLLLSNKEIKDAIAHVYVKIYEGFLNR